MIVVLVLVAVVVVVVVVAAGYCAGLAIRSHRMSTCGNIRVPREYAD